MSDIILKFWPKENPGVDKTQAITSMLETKGIIGTPKSYFGQEAFEPGENAQQYLAPGFTVSLEKAYGGNLSFVIEAGGNGVEIGAEDYEYPETMNIVSILGGDGSLERSDSICGFLEEATGDKYISEFEIL